MLADRDLSACHRELFQSKNSYIVSRNRAALITKCSPSGHLNWHCWAHRRAALLGGARCLRASVASR